MKLDTLSVVVTRATGGIGEHLTIQLARAGASICVLGRGDPDRLAELGRLERVRPLAADLATAQGRRIAVVSILDSGPVDVLVNNAGTQVPVNALGPPAWKELDL